MRADINMPGEVIRRSTRSRESEAVQVDQGPPQDENTENDYLEACDSNQPRVDVPYGHDDAADAKEAVKASHLDFLPRRDSTPNVRESQPDDDEVDDYFQVAIPTSSSGITTHAYQLALQNRIKNEMIRKHGEYDMIPYTPIFLHDCLMLPGSLVNVLGKLSVPEIVPRMTPALLPGFHSYVHSETHLPRILPSPNHEDYVQGMLLFGQSKGSRALIHSHYRDHARRVKVEVNIDVVVAISAHERDCTAERWRLNRRTVRAYAWIHSNAGSVDACFEAQVPEGWRIEKYLEGAYEPSEQRLNLEGPWPDAEVEVDDDEEWQEDRELVYGGCGSIDYIVQNRFTGW